METIQRLIEADKIHLQVFDLIVLRLLGKCSKPVPRGKLQNIIDGSGTRSSVSRMSLAVKRLYRKKLIQKTKGSTTCGLDLSLTPKGREAIG